MNPETRVHLVLTALLAPAFASSPSWTAEDLVRAHQRGLSADTIARMAETVTLDADTSVYLLRRGIPAETLRAWGHPVSEGEGVLAERLGALGAPAPGVSDADWMEMGELPTTITRDQGVISGDVFALSPTLAVVDTRDTVDFVVVHRAEARDVWVDARPLGAAISDELTDAPEDRRGPSVAERRLRGGRATVATGLLVTVASGMVFVLGAGGADELYGTGLAREVDPVVMAVGAVGLLGGGLTLHFGARDIRLAGAYAEGIPGLFGR